MFEVGKKYKGNWPGIVWTCLYTDGTNLIMQASNTGNKIHFNENEAWWTEYHVPVVEKHTKVITRNTIDNEEIIVMNKTNKDIIGAVEFTVTDGKLTDVRIVS